MTQVAVVTGANKGIGFSVVKQLAKQFKGTIYLTARNAANGEQAVSELQKEHLAVKFHELDITNRESCQFFCDYLKKEHGGIDILINNAGIAFSHGATEPFGYQAEVTMKTNYYGTKQFSDYCFPLLKPCARVVNVSSCLGHLSVLNAGKEPESKTLRQILGDPEITQATLDRLANEFINASQTGDHLKSGWINNSYGVSKVFVSVLTRIQQRELDHYRLKDNIIVNCVHPGYVKTSMTQEKGHLTPDQGATPIVWCALISSTSKTPRGSFVWNDLSIVDFNANTCPLRS